MTQETPKRASIIEDRPLVNKDDDVFRYHVVAAQLARTIVHRGAHEGWVMGISAPWGTGKSTVLEFMRQELLESSEPPAVVRFNPWWFTGQEDLVRHLFDELHEAVEGLLKKGAKKATKAFFEGLTLGKLELSALDFDAHGLKGSGNAALSVIGQMLAKQREIPRAKIKVADALRKQNRQVVVFVDDIDRLTAEEMRQLFTAVKAVGDLPNVVYVLAFDAKVVEDSLQRTQLVPGREYLEKIVQLQVSLPIPGQSALREFLCRRLDSVLERYAVLPLDKERWNEALLDGISPALGSPRNAIRVTNTLAALYPGVAGEVDVVDMVLICFLQVRFPRVHELIRDNIDRFVGPLSFGEQDGRSGLQAAQDFHKGWIGRLCDDEQRTSVELIVGLLFPRFQGIFKARHFGYRPYDAECERRGRVCVPRCAPRYFSFALPSTDISHSRIRDLLQGERSSEELLGLLGSLLQSDPAIFFSLVENLPPFIEGTSTEQRASMANALLRLGEDYVRAKPPAQGMFTFGPTTSLRRAVAFLLSGLDATHYGGAVGDAINSEHPRFAIEFVGNMLAREEKGNWDELKVPPSDALALLREIAKNRLVSLAAGDSLLLDSDQCYLNEVSVHAYSRLVGEVETRTWICDRVVASSHQFVSLLYAFLGESTVISRRTSTTTRSPNLTALLNFITADQLRNALVNAEGSDEVVGSFSQALQRYQPQHPPTSSAATETLNE